MDTPAQVNITVYKGVDFSETYIFQDSSGNRIDLSGYSFSGKIRETRELDGSLIATFSSDTSLASNGQVTLSLSSSSTDVDYAKAYYDVVLTSSLGASSIAIYGRVRFNDSVTGE